MPFHDTALPSDNYDKTFAPIAKMTIVWTVLAIAGSQGWPLQQMDVNNVFLHGKQEEIFMTLPLDMFATLSSKVCQLEQPLYGLKQAPLHGLISFALLRLLFVLLRVNLIHFSFFERLLQALCYF